MHEATDFSVSRVESIFGHEVTYVSGSKESIVVSINVFECVLHVEIDTLAQAVTKVFCCSLRLENCSPESLEF